MKHLITVTFDDKRTIREVVEAHDVGDVLKRFAMQGLNFQCIYSTYAVKVEVVRLPNNGVDIDEIERQEQE